MSVKYNLLVRIKHKTIVRDVQSFEQKSYLSGLLFD
jgi:hypothetical protein